MQHVEDTSQYEIPRPAPEAHEERLARPRVTGPGRLERRYQARIEELEGREEELSHSLEETRREVELAALVERGSSRMLDKLEEKLERSKEQGNRLLVALGALQRENELLRAEREQQALGGSRRRRLGRSRD